MKPLNICINPGLILMLLLLAGFNTVSAQSFVPENLGADVNSVYDDINPVLSPNGKTLYFSRLNHPENVYGEDDSQDIWFSTLRPDGSWSKASHLSGLNIGRYNAVLSVSPDNNTLLLNGIYNKKGNIFKKRGLSTSTKVGETWGIPVKLKVKKYPKKNRGMKSSGYMSADGKFIVLSYSRWYNSERSNIFVSKQKQNGKWKKPRRIKNIASPRSEDAPFLSSDNQTIYFSSDVKEKGKSDIYKSTRKGSDWNAWSLPVLLNDTINTQDWESFFKTNVKGSVAYFSSTHKSIGGADIFRVKLFEENPFVIVSGNLQNIETGERLIGKQISILINGLPADSVWVNSDSATYKVKLPLKKRYSISFATPNYTAIPDSIDVLHVREFTRMKKNLKARPFPYVDLTGKLLVQNTTEPIPLSADPKIIINGIRVDSAKVTDGSYSVRLNRGKIYSLQVDAKRYGPVPGTLDLTNVKEYTRMSLDLFASREKMANISGKVIRKQISKTASVSKGFKINVEGLNAVAAIDTLQSTYSLHLPLGKLYTLSASAPGYYPVYENVDVIAEHGDVNINKDLTIILVEVGQSIRLNNIFFESGKAVLKKQSFAELDRVVEFLSGNEEIKIEIAGHTDNVGKVATNNKLSQARAQAVADYIIKKGVAKPRILAKGYGSSKPVATNKTAVGKAQNRRVEFTVLDK